MVITTNMFSSTILSVFSLIRLGFPVESKNAFAYYSTMSWTLFNFCLIYPTVHMGHYARREVSFCELHPAKKLFFTLKK